MNIFNIFKKLDAEEDDDAEPVDVFLERKRHPLLEGYYSAKHVLHGCWFRILVFFDRLFNRGIAKADLWSLNNTLAEYIYPRLLRFRNAKLHGYPHAFSEREEWESEEKYNAELATGERVGGEQEAWIRTIDEMLFGFEYVLFREMTETPKGKEFWLKYYGKTPWDRLESNRHTHYHYCMKNPPEGLSRWMSTARLLSPEECEEKGCELRYTREFFRNFELESEAAKRAAKAMELFGRYYLNLWD
jgi:hypothetical protein